MTPAEKAAAKLKALLEKQKVPQSQEEADAQEVQAKAAIEKAMADAEDLARKRAVKDEPYHRNCFTFTHSGLVHRIRHRAGSTQMI